MWDACLRRDREFDGLFITAVRTTGIFCRPSCPARKPLRKNVEFFPSPSEAIAAGYRACLRCRPLEAAGAPPDWVRGLLQQMEETPDRRITDADLRATGTDPARARRYFKEHFGMTFQAYQRASRLGSAFTRIREGDDLTGVGFDHGYESTSGFRDAFHRLFGETPGRSRDGDALRVRWMETPVGPFVTAATDEGICLFEFSDRKVLETQVTSVQRRLDRPALPGCNTHIEQLEDEVKQYFAGELDHFTVPLMIRGTPFQERVWRGLLEIPYGNTWSYDRLARHIGSEGGQRAVGRANGQNPMAVIVPCHRVIRADGQLGGYGGGLWRKRFLLDLEGATYRDGKTPATSGQLELLEC
jgi:AraC family transcriptional regulator of adaptative response/methylated-DNA-[protein]-cysteine methyltransferase